ncbi:MAG: cytochrome P450 [Turneriella sp.]
MFDATSVFGAVALPKPPAPPSLPLIGNYFQLKNDSLEFLRRAARDYGDVVRIEYLTQVFYLISNPDYIERLLLTENSSVMKDLGEQMLKKTFLGTGLLTAEGEEHKQMRKMSSPAFGRTRILGYGDIMSRLSLEEFAQWKSGEIVDVHYKMSQLAQRIVARTLFDSDGNDNSLVIGEIMAEIMPVIALRNFAEFFMKFPTGLKARVERNIAKLDSIIYSIIDDHLVSGTDRGDFLSMLIEGKKARWQEANAAAEGSAHSWQPTSAERKQLRDEALTIYLAGFETTANAMTWTLHLLAGHPKQQQRMADEVRSVLGQRSAQATDMPNLPYTRAVISESMRLFPPAWVIGRVLLKDFRFGDYTIPQGAEVWMSQYVMHRDARYFKNADAFEPERWLEPGFAPSRFVYFPFSAGPRNCIGEQFAWLEATVVLANALNQFSFSNIGEKVETEPLVTLRPKGGLRLRISHRR